MRARPRTAYSLRCEIRPGLTPEGFERAFQAFHTTKPNGMGLGLSICRSIVEAHSGRLWATANVPRGAIFQFTLGRADAWRHAGGGMSCWFVKV